jgi:exopolysaccharide biosynthesis protein
MAVSFMRIDLRNSAYELITMVTDDPDDQGPAEAVLELPTKIMNKYGAFAAVNANAFARAANADDKPGWHKGLYVDIRGLTVSEGKIVSVFDDKSGGSKTPFWLDKQNTPSTQMPQDSRQVQNAVSDWISPILTNGEIVAAKDAQRHPRTLVGTDKQKRFITLAVVDGRRKDYSDGMTLYETAQLMLSQGCYNAVNLDGGGSSIMLYSDDEKTIKTANKPSDNSHRPIPVMLGVRKTASNSN